VLLSSLPEDGDDEFAFTIIVGCIGAFELVEHVLDISLRRTNRPQPGYILLKVGKHWLDELSI
jgi:hypothetical protein